MTVMTTNGCTYDTTWIDRRKIDVTDIQIFGDTLDCDTDSVQLFADTMISPNLRYEWRGPGNFMSDLSAPLVREHGTYTLTLRTKNGCQIQGQYEVVLDTLKPNVQIQAGILDCTIDSVRFLVTEDEDAYLYHWEGPSNFYSTRKRPWAPEPGWYYTTVTKVNGCIAFFSRFVDTDYDVPTDTIIATDITCKDLSSTVHLGTDATFVEWRGDGFASNDVDLVLPALDTYSLYMIGSNGCDTTLSYTPPVDTAHPVLQLYTDILGCNRPEVPVYYSSDLAIDSVNWSGPAVGMPHADSIRVSSAGLYTLSALSLNGCESNESINVIESYVIPDIDIDGTIATTCTVDTVRLHAVTSTADLTFNWTLPDGEVVADSAIVTVSPGDYALAVEALNSCRDTAYFTVVADTLLPVDEFDGRFNKLSKNPGYGRCQFGSR